MEPGALDTLTTRYRNSWENGVDARWRFCQHLLEFVEANPTFSLREIGEACARAVNREKPYNRYWAGWLVAAAKKHPLKPTTVAERREFMADLRGGRLSPISNAEARRAHAASPEFAARMVRAFACKAVAAGMDVESLVAMIRKAVKESQKSRATHRAAA